MCFCRNAVITLVLAAFCPWLTAEELPEEKMKMEELLVTGKLTRTSATKSDTPIMETSRSVDIIPEHLLIDRGALHLDNALTYNAGVVGMPYGFATRGDFAFIRGLEGPLYQDSLQSLFGNYNNPRPDIYNIEQVEILKGPAGALYGKGSPGGLINIVSKRPQEAARRELMGAFGNFNYGEAAIDFTGPLDDQGQWLYRLVAVYRETDTQVNHVDDNRRVLAPSLTWRPTDRTDITLLAALNRTRADTAAQFLNLSGTLYPAANGQRIDYDAYMGDTSFNKYNPESKSVTVLVNQELNDVWSMEVNSRYTDAKADYQQTWATFGFAPPIPRYSPAYINNDRYLYNADGTLYQNGLVPRTWSRADSTSEQYAIDTRFRADFTTGAVGHEVLMGAQYQDVSTSTSGYNAYALGYGVISGGLNSPFGDAYWIDVFNPSSAVGPSEQVLADLYYTEQPNVDSTDMGVYISDQMTIGRWIPTLGVRFDQTETDDVDSTQSDSKVSTSVGLLYQLDNGLAPYVSYADTFEPEIGDNGRGEALDPREGRQYEAGIKYEPDAYPGLITLAAFDIHQTNLPDPLARPGFYEQQSGKAKIRGVELESQVALGAFFWQFSFSQLDTQNPEGYRLASVPDTQASTWLSYRPQGAWSGFKSGVGIRYVGDSRDGADRNRTSSYTLGDLMIGYEQLNWDIALNVNNVTDKEFLATCLARSDCFPGARRTVVGTVRYIF